MPIKTITVGPGKLTIGAESLLTNFQSQVTSCKLAPSVDKGGVLNVLSGEQRSGERKESFTIEGTLLQDLGADKSTTEWLFDHRGETHALEFVPSTAAGKAIRCSVVVEAIDIGGDVQSNPTSDFKFDVIGTPVISAPTAAGDIPAEG